MPTWQRLRAGQEQEESGDRFGRCISFHADWRGLRLADGFRFSRPSSILGLPAVESGELTADSAPRMHAHSALLAESSFRSSDSNTEAISCMRCPSRCWKFEVCFPCRPE